jgi:hypothetical protein
MEALATRVAPSTAREDRAGLRGISRLCSMPPKKARVVLRLSDEAVERNGEISHDHVP